MATMTTTTTTTRTRKRTVTTTTTTTTSTTATQAARTSNNKTTPTRTTASTMTTAARQTKLTEPQQQLQKEQPKEDTNKERQNISWQAQLSLQAIDPTNSEVLGNCVSQLDADGASMHSWAKMQHACFSLRGGRLHESLHILFGSQNLSKPIAPEQCHCLRQQQPRLAHYKESILFVSDSDEWPNARCAQCQCQKGSQQR